MPELEKEFSRLFSSNLERYTTERQAQNYRSEGVLSKIVNLKNSKIHPISIARDFCFFISIVIVTTLHIEANDEKIGSSRQTLDIATRISMPQVYYKPFNKANRGKENYEDALNKL
jgi:hypothetical protein